MPDSASPSGNFLHKPVCGWLHPDQQILQKGATYNVRYVGCLEVTTSMKSLEFDARFQIAKECINRVCEAACLKTADKKRKIDKRVLRAIGDQPNMKYAGSNVELSISSTCLALKLHDSGTVIASHEMPHISFASGGDAETLDFVAYVAKDSNNWRACYVLECGNGQAQEVITTIGQAFDLRFKQFMSRPAVESGELCNEFSDWLKNDSCNSHCIASDDRFLSFQSINVPFWTRREYGGEETSFKTEKHLEIVNEEKCADWSFSATYLN